MENKHIQVKEEKSINLDKAQLKHYQRKINILLVDDNKEWHVIMRSAIEYAGDVLDVKFALHDTYNMEEARDFLKNFSDLHKERDDTLDIILLTGSRIEDLNLGEKQCKYVDRYINKGECTLDKLILNILVLIGSYTIYSSYQQKFDNTTSLYLDNIEELKVTSGFFHKKNM